MLASPQDLLSPALGLVQTAYGTGVVAHETIQPGDVLVHVPASLCITARRALMQREVAQLLEGHHFEAHVAIAMWLMHAADHRPDAFVPWLDLLPASFDCTISWSHEELSWLQTSPARKRAEVMQRGATSRATSIVQR